MQKRHLILNLFLALFAALAVFSSGLVAQTASPENPSGNAAPAPAAPAANPASESEPASPVAPGTTEESAPAAEPTPPPGTPSPAPAPTVRTWGPDPVADDFPAFQDSLLPGIDEAKSSAGEEGGIQEALNELSSGTEEDSGGFLESLREKLGSDRTIINILVLLGLFVIYLLYRKRSRKNRRSYS